MTNRLQPYLRWLPMITMMIIIFAFSHQARADIPSFGIWDFLVKKGAHVIGYAMLAITAYWAFGRWRWALVVTILYAVSDEWHQTFVPGRSGTIVDVFIDSIGAVLGLTIYIRWLEPRLMQYRWYQEWLAPVAS